MKKIRSFLSACSRLKVWTRVLSMALSLVMLFYVIPTVVYGEIANAIDNIGIDEKTEQINEEKEAASYTYEGVLYEVESLREESVKHFHLEDGTYIAAQYPNAVHTLDENGEWQDIDNALEEVSGGVYANASARIKFAKKITGNESLFTLHDGNTKITMSLVGAKKKTVGQVTNNTDAEELTELQKMMNLEKLSSSIKYEEILDGVDIEYIASSLNIKENIIVKAKSESYTYTFELSLNGLSAELSESGDVIIKETNGEEIKYTIPAPIVYDADGVYASADEAYYTLTDGKNGEYTLSVTVSSEWMNVSDRAYPVVVDPTLTNNSTASEVTITTISSAAGQQQNAYPDMVEIGVNQNTRSYWKINTLPKLSRFAYVNKVDFRMKRSTGSGAYVSVYQVTKSWDKTLTWYKTITGSFEGNISSQMLDYQHITPNEDGTYGDNGIFSWDITEAARQWYDSSTANYGVAIVSTDSPSITFEKPSDSTTGPYLVITYRDMKGVEPYLSYSSQNVGLAGVGNVNHATGQFTFSIGTVATSDALFSFVPTFVYNSALSELYFNSVGATTGSVTYMPSGFKMNIQQTIVERTCYDETNTLITYYVWSDEDGTEHSFMPSDSENIYYDEDGLLLTLNVVNSTDITITDTDLNVLTFEYVSSASAWCLISIMDKSLNELYITLDGVRPIRPTSISLNVADISSLEMLRIGYTSKGVPMYIYNVNNKEAAVFRYSDNGTGSTFPTSSHYLREVVYIQGTSSMTENNLSDFYQDSTVTANINVIGTSSYQYVSSDNLVVTDELSGVRVSYTVGTGRKVTRVDEYAKNTLGTYDIGQSLLFTYKAGYTEVRSSGSDDVISTDDDIITRYVFDDYGRVVSSYSKDVSGKTIYGAVSGVYETQENAKNNVKETTTFGGTFANYIKNGAFDRVDSSTNLPLEWTVIGNTALSIYTKDYRMCENCVNINVSSAAEQGLYQIVSLKQGEYTLSVNFKAQNATGVTAYLKAESMTDSTEKYETEIPVYESSEAEYLTVSLPVTVTSTSGDSYKISVVISGSTGISTSAKVEIDDVMLSDGINIPTYNMVEEGGFNNFSYGGSSSTDNTAIQAMWSGTYSISDYQLRLTGALTAQRYAKQLIYKAPEDVIIDYTMGAGSAYVSNATQTYLVSGFALSETAVRNPDSVFAINLIAVYCNEDGSETEVYHRFDFQSGCKSLQFVSGSVVIKDDGYECLKEVYIACEYYNQPAGYAYFDNISVVEDTKSSVAQYTYAENGLVSKMTRGLYEEIYTYSGYNLIRYDNSYGETITYTYSANGRNLLTESLIERQSQYNTTTGMWEYFDVVKREQRYEYNIYGLIQKIQATDCETEEVIFTEYTYVTSMQYGFENIGAPLSASDERGIVTRYYYSSDSGRLHAVINTEYETGISYLYDDAGRLTNVMPATYVSDATYTPVTNAEEVEYGYNDRGLLSTISTQTTTYTFNYDMYGNKESVEAGNSTLAEYIYNTNNGKLEKVEYGNGFAIRYVYDTLENVSEIWYTENGTERKAYEYSYTSTGQIHKFRDIEAGKVTLYSYDASGRLVNFAEHKESDDYNEFSVNYRYNLKDQLSGLTYRLRYTNNSVTTSDNMLYSFYYTDEGLVYQTSISFEAASGYVKNIYDRHNRITEKVYSYTSKVYTGETHTNTVDYVYYDVEGSTNNSTNLVKSYTTKASSYTAVTYTYTYDANGNIVQIESSNGKIIKYTYDELGQLVREDNSDIAITYVYEYDNAGNITAVKNYGYKADGTLGNLLKTKTYGYSTSAWGDQLTSYNGNTITYDAIGNPLTYNNGTSYVFTWEGRNLVGAVVGTGTSQKTITFTYNDEGIRTSKTVNGVKYTYILDGSQIVGELWEDKAMLYIYDADGSPIGMQYREETYAQGEWDVYWYEKDLQGNVIAVYNARGLKYTTYRYDAWGKKSAMYDISETDLLYRNPFRYRGYYYDVDLGMYYLQSRYYDSEVGRFISPDAPSYLGANGDLISYNLYAYCSNNPVMYTDPSGHLVLSSIIITIIITAVVGAVIGGIYGGVTASANDQNVLAGVFIGAGAGLIMGAGAGLASVYLAPVLAGQAATIGVGSALAIGSSIAFGSGMIGGMAADAITQIVNDGGVHDWESVVYSGIEWGTINTASAFLGSIGGPTSKLENGLLSAIFGSVASAVGMTVDILRNRAAQKKNISSINALSYNF